MGAGCVSSPKDQDEMPPVNMDEAEPPTTGTTITTKRAHHSLQPTSSVALLFSVMSEDIGYEQSELAPFCEKLQCLWIYRVVDVLEMPSVLEHVIRDYLDELKSTKSFRNFRRASQTDIFSVFISKDIRSLLGTLKTSVEHLPSAQQHLTYLERVLGEQYLFNIKMLRKYMTRQQWRALAVPENLKRVIATKIDLRWESASKLESIRVGEGEQEQVQEVACATPNIVAAECSDSEDEAKAEAMVIANNRHDFDDMLNRDVNVRFSMRQTAQYLAKLLFVDDAEAVFEHLSYFARFGYKNLYLLQFVSDDLFAQLLAITRTPLALRRELFEVVAAVRAKYAECMSRTAQMMPFTRGDDGVVENGSLKMDHEWNTIIISTDGSLKIIDGQKHAGLGIYITYNGKQYSFAQGIGCQEILHAELRALVTSFHLLRK